MMKLGSLMSTREKRNTIKVPKTDKTIVNITPVAVKQKLMQLINIKRTMNVFLTVKKVKYFFISFRYFATKQPIGKHKIVCQNRGDIFKQIANKM